MEKVIPKKLLTVALASVVWVACVQHCAAKRPTAEELFKQAVDAAEIQHDPDKAIALMERVLKSRPRALNAYIALSVYYARDKRNLPKAESIIKRALVIAPADFACQYQYAQVLADQKRLVAAQNVLLKANAKTGAERAKRDKVLKLITDYAQSKKQ